MSMLVCIHRWIEREGGREKDARTGARTNCACAREHSPKHRREDAAEHACCGDAKSKDFLRAQGGKCIHGQRQEISMNIQMNLSMDSERSRQDTQQDMHAFFCLVFRTPNPRCAQDPPYVYVYRYICIYVYIYVCGMHD